MKALIGLALVALSMPGSSRADTLEAMDLPHYCRMHHGASSQARALDRDDASSWRCRAEGAWVGIDLAQVCHEQFGRTAQFRLGDKRDASSWKCLVRDDGADEPARAIEPKLSYCVFFATDRKTMYISEFMPFRSSGIEAGLIDGRNSPELNDLEGRYELKLIDRYRIGFGYGLCYAGSKARIAESYDALLAKRVLRSAPLYDWAFIPVKVLQ